MLQLKACISFMSICNTNVCCRKWFTSERMHYFSERMKVTTVLFHNLSWDYLSCPCASVILCVHVCAHVCEHSPPVSA